MPRIFLAGKYNVPAASAAGTEFAFIRRNADIWRSVPRPDLARLAARERDHFDRIEREVLRHGKGADVQEVVDKKVAGLGVYEKSNLAQAAYDNMQARNGR